MKLSVSLPDEDIELIDGYIQQNAAASRSAVIHRALSLLRKSQLESEYAAAWEEWRGSEDEKLWDATTGDGMTHASW